MRILHVWLCLITTVPTENVVQRQSHMMQIALQVTFLNYCIVLNSCIAGVGELLESLYCLMLFDEIITYVFSKGC